MVASTVRILAHAGDGGGDARPNEKDEAKREIGKRSDAADAEGRSGFDGGRRISGSFAAEKWMLRQSTSGHFEFGECPVRRAFIERNERKNGNVVSRHRVRAHVGIGSKMLL